MIVLDAELVAKAWGFDTVQEFEQAAREAEADPGIPWIVDADS